MIAPHGPGSPFQLLFDDESSMPHSLPDAFRAVYPADWRIHLPKGRTYIYTNFGMSRDGKISYNEPGQEEAYYVTKADPHDRWIMALLRMRADTFMIGDTTLKLEKEHFETSGSVCPWTAEFIAPHDAEALAAQRAAEGLKPLPLLVVLSIDGNVDLNTSCFSSEDRQIVFATTAQGAQKVQEIGVPPNVDIHALGEQSADLNRLTQMLYSDYGSRQLLCEGGATLFANLLDQALVDEEFVTWCPTFVGRSRDRHRPSYTEGVAWMPDRAPYSKPISLQRGGDCIFLRTRCDYGNLSQ
jgi:riboflavin biosynthesis pyrimidine reductase